MATDLLSLQGFRNSYPQIIFVGEDEEMEIGSPTDVKHVAHIGWDGPSANGPTWMKEFSNVPEFQSSLRADTDLPGPNLDGDRPSLRLGTGIDNLMGSKSDSRKATDHATGEEASSMKKKLKWKKIKSMSSKSSRSPRTGKSKPDIQSIAVAAGS